MDFPCISFLVSYNKTLLFCHNSANLILSLSFSCFLSGTFFGTCSACSVNHKPSYPEEHVTVRQQRSTVGQSLGVRRGTNTLHECRELDFHDEVSN